MSRIIINNKSNLPDADVLIRIKHVIEGGRISNYDTQYCYLTTWTDGIAVAATKRKGSDSFTVWRINA